MLENWFRVIWIEERGHRRWQELLTPTCRNSSINTDVFFFMLKTNSSKEFFSWKDKYWKYLTIYVSQWVFRNTRLSRNVAITLYSSPWIPINSFQFSPCLIQECIVTGLMIELKSSGYSSSVIAFGLDLLCRKPGSFAF